MIEVDGVDVEKQVVDKIHISVGQRYSVIVTANAKPGIYLMRSKLDTMVYSNYVPGTLMINTTFGALRYPGFEHVKPTQSEMNNIPASTAPLDTYGLTPVGPNLDQLLPPKTSNQHLLVYFAITPNDKNESRAYVSVDGYFDSSQYMMPSVPVLNSLVHKRRPDASANIIYLDKGEVIDITVFNDGK